MITREPFAANGFSLGRVLYAMFGGIGRAGCLTGQALGFVPGLPGGKRQRAEWVKQMYLVGIKSLPIVTIVGMFTGMILALQVGLELRRYNQEIYIGSAVMVSMLREMGPFMTGLILAACVGSSMAAQIGTMTVNDEVAALAIMSIDPVRFLMTPRIAAMAIMTPVLSFYTCVL